MELYCLPQPRCAADAASRLPAMEPGIADYLSESSGVEQSEREEALFHPPPQWTGCVVFLGGR